MKGWFKMDQVLYSIYDKKAKVFGLPFHAPSDVVAMRQVSVAAKDPQLQLAMFPDDFDLYQIGYFDDQTGKITVPGVPVFVIAVCSLSKLMEGKKDGN